MSGGAQESRTCQQVSRGERSPGNPLSHQPHERRLVVLQQLRGGQRLHPVAEQAVDLDAELGPLDCHVDLSRAHTRGVRGGCSLTARAHSSHRSLTSCCRRPLPPEGTSAPVSSPLPSSKEDIRPEREMRPRGRAGEGSERRPGCRRSASTLRGDRSRSVLRGGPTSSGRRFLRRHGSEGHSRDATHTPVGESGAREEGPERTELPRESIADDIRSASCESRRRA